MVDIVSIGYEINAKGLEKANKEVDALHAKIDKLGKTKPVDTMAGTNTKQQVAGVDAVTKALEKQTLVGQYLGKGYDRSTANTIASFKMLGASVDQTNSQLNQLVQNKGLVKQQQDALALSKAQQKVVDQQRASIALQEKQITLARSASKYRSEGFTSTNATKLSTFELSGASTSNMDAYKKALMDAQGGLKQFGVVAEDTSKKVGFLNTEIGGIAKYALLSAVIYGLMTATVNLALATVKMADEYTAIQNRMKLYIKTSEELGQVNQKLAQFSVENNVGLRETSTLFARLAPSMQRLGKDTNAITTVVDSFGKSMRIGGATAMEAASATIQFSQAMASGKLAGDEFRSISEASPRFLKAIADGSGIATEKLKEMSSAGMLTTEVISKALIKEYAKLSSENAKLGITLEQGTNAIKTMFTVMVGEFNEGAGITKFFGESMVSLAQSMKDTSDGAKEAGQSFSAFFKDNADTISFVVESFKALAIIVASRYVVAIVLARIESIRYTATLIAMSSAQTGVSRTATLATASITAMGNASKTALAFFGGWVGLALTVAGVAGSYLLMRDNASEANQKLVEQSEVVNTTASSFAKLNAQQKENAKIKFNLEMGDINKNLDEARDKYLSMVDALSGSTFGLEMSDQVKELRKQVEEGTVTFDDATSKLLKMGVVSEDSAKQLFGQAKVYKDASSEAMKYTTTAKALNVELVLGGNKAENTALQLDKTKNSTKELGNEAVNTARKFKDMGEEFRKTISKNDQIIKVMKSSGLGQGTATDVVTTVNKNYEIASSRFETASSNYKKAQGLLAKVSPTDSRRASVEASVASAKKAVDSAEQFLNLQKEKASQGLVPLAKRIEAQEESLSNMKKEDKESDKLLKKNNDITSSYTEQYESVNRLQAMLANNVSYDVAKIASQKEYAKVFTSTSEAILIVEAERLNAQIDYEASLREQRTQQMEVLGLVGMGVSLEQAKTIASMKYNSELSKRQVAESSSLNTIVDQVTSVASLLRDQENLNTILADGLSLEEAQLEYSFSRLSNLREQKGTLSDMQQTLKENAVLDIKNLEVRKAQGELIKANNALIFESKILTQTQDNDLASIMVQYKGVTVEQAKSLSISEKITQKLSEYNDLMKEQATLSYDLGNVNFDAFGDFGNPFESALGGLNDMIFGAQQLKTAYDEASSVLATRMADAIMKGEDYSNLEQQRANLTLTYEADKERASKKAINSALTLTKSMFKEETKGYKVITALERTYQGLQVAFALWKKKDSIVQLAMSLKAHVMDALGFTTAATTKVASQGAVNVAKGTEAVLSQGSGDPYSAFARMAAMVAVVAGLGVAIGSISGSSSSGSVAPSNEGTGTVFGDSSAQSKSIKNSIDLLADNSDLMLPVNNAMLRSLRNIESSIGGVVNLLVRGDFGTDLASGFDAKFTGSLAKFDKLVTGVEGFVDKVSIGKMLGFDIRGVVSGIGSSILGGLFGKTSQKVTGSGIKGWAQSLGDIMTNGFALNSYADIKTTKKSLFSSSTSYSTQYGKVGNEIKDQFAMIFTNVYDSILSASSILEKDEGDVIKKLKATIINIGKIQTSGLSGEAIQEKLEAVIGQQSDLVAKLALGGLEPFQKVGEGYYETVVRVATGIEQASYYTDQLGYTAIKYTDIINKQGDVSAEIVRQSVLLTEKTKGINGAFYDLVNTFDGTAEELTSFIFNLRDLQEMLEMTGKSSDYLTSAMILGAGGLDTLKSGFDAYYEMLSPAEQASELTRRLTADFDKLNITLPDGVKAFRDLVSSIDISSEAGQKLYGQIIALAPEFNDLQDALESANSDINALVQSLRDLANEAKKARGETDQNRNLEATRYAYQQNAVLAMQGDTDAAQKLLDLGKNLMTLSGKYSVTASEYARDLALIQQSATVSADVQEAGLGFTNEPLTPVSTVGGSTTLATSNTGTDAKLEALSEKLEAYLLAITKNTQPLARLDDWDDGGRMTVRVEQDTVNDAIPVTML